ncbi:hypothetical protein HanRHA438_Chr11g0524251 [Helianthus annuus]|nr:hypothetical protein HanIR_Chr11g0550511 [Helianthus annuus]KAJ0872485.1 hypothetical protein HanRHA438_Chr11g0524251 [Helianthus annuus]
MHTGCLGHKDGYTDAFFRFIEGELKMIIEDVVECGKKMEEKCEFYSEKIFF